MEGNASFGYWIRRRRKALDLTQDELARQVGCALSTIRKIEADERRPSRQVAERLADLLELGLQERAAFLKAARAEQRVDQLAEPTAFVPISSQPAAPAAPINLPAAPTRLVGRTHELAQAGALLRRADVRLLTLTGPGGVGKTRLAVAAAAAQRDAYLGGVWFVALAPIRDPELVPSTIAQALGIKEGGNQPILEDIKRYLHDRQALLLLDNFEHVAAAAPLVAELLLAVPGLTALVTSRAVLHLSGEHELPVPPLAVPPSAVQPVERADAQPPAERIIEYDAVRLFVERAQAANAAFALTRANAPAVATICRRLDGLPLAIELAAARSKLFAPAALLARLEHRLSLLTGGAHDLPARQQTLRGTIDWSYNLLDPAEQTLFARLSVFAGGCTIAAAEAICNTNRDLATYALDWLTALADKSLLLQEQTADGEPRFSMLETIREYAQERLEQSGEMAALHEAHLAYFLMLAEQAEPELIGPRQAEWLERLEREHDNLRAALDWALERGLVEQAGRLGGALWRFWYMRGHLMEGRRWLESVRAQIDTSTRSIQAKVSLGLGTLAWAQGDAHHAQTLFEASSALYAEERDDFSLALSLNGLGLVAIHQEDYMQATAHFEAGLVLRRRLGNAWGVAGSLISLGVVALDQGENERAIAHLTESLMIFREVGEQRGIGTALSNLALIAYRQADYVRALTLAKESYELMQALGNKQMIVFALSIIGQCMLAQGDSEGAQQHLIEALDLCQEINDPRLSDVLVCLGDVALARHNAYRAALIYSAAASYREQRHLPLSPVERSQQERTFVAVRARLDDPTFAAAWAAGRALTIEQAIAEALGLVA